MKIASYYQVMESPLGKLTLISNGRALTAVHTGSVNVSSFERGDRDAVVLKAKKQLAEYFSGKRKTFELPMDADGTPFQKKVWRALSKIPYGKTASYKDIAQMIGNPKACRAVGSANGKNPLCILVPCHRIISADGSLGGYSGGLSKKRYLLVLEQGL